MAQDAFYGICGGELGDGKLFNFIFPMMGASA